MLLKKFIICVLLLTVLSATGIVSAAPITSPFGWRVHPITGEYKFHTGLDIGYDYGDGIAAMLPGKVVYSGWYGGYGTALFGT